MMFQDVYSSAHQSLDLRDVALRLVEEVGEVANAIRALQTDTDSFVGLEGEIADVFSWIAMLFLKLEVWKAANPTAWDFEDGTDVVSLSDVFTLSWLLWQVYGARSGLITCPNCGKRPCIEPIPEEPARIPLSASKAIGRSRSRSIITIDGPVGSGKSTVARRVAELLGLTYLDSGAMYRALALKAIRHGVPLDAPTQLEALARETQIDLHPTAWGLEVLLDGKDATREIRAPEVALASSRVAMVPGVRKVLVQLQRRAGKQGGVVMEGRDIGSVVFPDAQLKIFLTASPETRAERRWREHQQKGDQIDLARTLEEIRERDRRDQERESSPLVRAADAVVVDSTAMEPEEVARLVVLLAHESTRAAIP